MARNTGYNLIGIGTGVLLTGGGLFGLTNAIPYAEASEGYRTGTEQSFAFVGSQLQVGETLFNAAVHPEKVTVDRHLGRVLLADMTLVEIVLGVGLLTGGVVGLRK